MSEEVVRKRVTSVEHEIDWATVLMVLAALYVADRTGLLDAAGAIVAGLASESVGSSTDSGGEEVAIQVDGAGLPE